MSRSKKDVRKKFRDVVFKRDKHKCQLCSSSKDLEAHHITDRNWFENGGYVVENGITLCPGCHIKAENLEVIPEEFYEMIGSSFELAERKDK